MPAIDIEKTIILHLMACNVPKSVIKIVRAANADFVTVSVHGPHETLSRNYSAFQLLNGNPYVVDEMCALAHWYHSEHVPVQWRKAPQTPWQREWQDFVGCWMATPRFMRVGLTLVVIALIAKMAGLYQ
jgi:hypothetical protein